MVVIDMNKNREIRRGQILSATLTTLRKFGAKDASTLKIAREANCSKETIYRWFGSRQGLFEALIEAQSDSVNNALEKALSSGGDTKQNLEAFCAALLDLLSGEASVLINRAAMAQIGEGSQLATVLLEAGRARTMPLAAKLLEKARDEGLLCFEGTSTVFKTLYGLAIGDTQILCLLGAKNARPSGEVINQRAAQAVERLFQIYQC